MGLLQEKDAALASSEVSLNPGSPPPPPALRRRPSLSGVWGLGCPPPPPLLVTPPWGGPQHTAVYVVCLHHAGTGSQRRCGTATGHRDCRPTTAHDRSPWLHGQLDGTDTTPGSTWSLYQTDCLETASNTSPADRTDWNNVGLMLGHRLRRWPNINPALFQCVLLAGLRREDVISQGPYVSVLRYKKSGICSLFAACIISHILYLFIWLIMFQTFRRTKSLAITSRLTALVVWSCMVSEPTTRWKMRCSTSPLAPSSGRITIRMKLPVRENATTRRSASAGQHMDMGLIYCVIKV